MIRTATPGDLPALGPVYAAARRFMAENGNPTQWSDRYPLTEDLEEDIGKGQLYVWAPDGAVHGAFVLQLGEEANYREIQGAWRSDTPYGTIHRVASDGAVPGLFAACMDFCRARVNHLRIDTHRDNGGDAVSDPQARFCPLRHHLGGGRHPPAWAYEWLAEA